MVAADTAFRLGDWDAADLAALEALQVAGDAGQPAIEGWVLTTRARILAARGRREACLAAALADQPEAPVTGRGARRAPA
jgi:hypothetical protein